MLSVGAAIVAYISCEAAQRLKLADSAKLFALTFLLVTFGAQDGISESYYLALHLTGVQLLGADVSHMSMPAICIFGMSPFRIGPGFCWISTMS